MPIMNLAAPGTKYGPCAGADCPHPRCKKARRTAVMICPPCDKEIGYGVNFVKEEHRGGRLVHVTCSLLT